MSQKAGSIGALVAGSRAGALPNAGEQRPPARSIPKDAEPHRAADFDIFCFGAFAVYHGGAYLPLPRNHKTAVVLRYLVLRQHHRVSREVLIELCWPDDSPKAAGNSLNTTISVLRKTLAAALDGDGLGSLIVYDEAQYYLNPALHLRVDVAEFDDCHKRGLAHEQAGRLDAALAAYRDAVGLYRGDLVLGDAYDDWLIIERERLVSTYLLLLHKLSAFCCDGGQYDEAISYAHDILAHDPCREDAHLILMRCFARLGQRVQALRQYDLCHSLLRRELRIDPAPELLDLRRQIERGETV